MKNNRLKITEATQSHYHSITQISVQCFGEICSLLKWAQNKKILKKYISQLNKYDEKVLVKLLGCIIENIKISHSENIVERVRSEMKKNSMKVVQGSLMEQLLQNKERTARGRGTPGSGGERAQTFQEEGRGADQQREDIDLHNDPEELLLK